MSKPSVLVDLLFAHKNNGFSGIPQDSRLLFDGLSRLDGISVNGLIWSSGGPWLGKALDNLEEQSVFLGPHLAGKEGLGAGTLSRALSVISPKLQRIYRRQVLERRKRKAGLYRLDKGLGLDQVWRSFFAPTLPSESRALLKEAEFYLTDTGLSRVNDAMLLGRKAVHLDTKGHDFVLFQDSRPVRVTEGTVRIIRYHDGLPVYASDTILNEIHIRAHIRSIKFCEEDSIFVCNSPSAVEDLRGISAKAAERARVIPYFLPKMERVNASRETLRQIVETRISPATVIAGEEEKTIKSWFGADTNESMPEYIMSLATIEPRKNYVGLIDAWQKLRLETKLDIKLTIVGAPGWEFEATLSKMRPFVKQGLLLHLEKVAQHELPYLYSGASCFVFPSFAEGFGLPPNEAMQCGCPVSVSDIAAHRYSAGDAALYFDPYDIDDIKEKMKSIISKGRDSNLVQELIAKGEKNAERYSVETVLPEWESLFAELMSVKREEKRSHSHSGGDAVRQREGAAVGSGGALLKN